MSWTISVQHCHGNFSNKNVRQKCMRWDYRGIMSSRLTWKQNYWRIASPLAGHCSDIIYHKNPKTAFWELTKLIDIKRQEYAYNRGEVSHCQRFHLRLACSCSFMSINFVSSQSVRLRSKRKNYRRNVVIFLPWFQIFHVSIVLRVWQLDVHLSNIWSWKLFLWKIVHINNTSHLAGFSTARALQLFRFSDVSLWKARDPST